MNKKFDFSEIDGALPTAENAGARPHNRCAEKQL